MSQHVAYQRSVSSHISTTVGSDTIILDTNLGRYFSLENVGTKIWEALEKPKTFEQLLTLILSTYEVEHETAKRDLKALLATLGTAGLVETC